MYYGDSEYQVEIFDRVEVRMDTGRINEGEVIAIQPRKNMLKVRYWDSDDLVRTTGGPRRKTGLFALENVDLLCRTDS